MRNQQFGDDVRALIGTARERGRLAHRDPESGPVIT
jgi:hypothetical protein